MATHGVGLELVGDTSASTTSNPTEKSCWYCTSVFLYLIKSPIGWFEWSPGAEDAIPTGVVGALTIADPASCGFVVSLGPERDSLAQHVSEPERVVPVGCRMNRW